MLPTLLLAAAPCWALERVQVELTPQDAHLDDRTLVLDKGGTTRFDSLQVDTRSAAFGTTALVYGEREGFRTHAPIAVVRRDPKGRARLVVSWRAAFAPVPEATLTVDAVRDAVSPGLAAADVGPVRWWLVGDELRLARAVWSDHPTDGLTHPRLLVDAGTARVLAREEDASHGLGHDPEGPKSPAADVYPVDPELTPELQRVELPESARHTLAGAHLTVSNCLDLGTTYSTNSDLGTVDLRQCEARSPVPPDGGQWLFTPEPYPLDTALDEDPFAAPHLLFHGEETLTAFETLGLSLAERPEQWQRLMAETNRRTVDLFDETSMSDPDAALAPYDNAFFRRGRERSDGSYTHPELVFGQGTVGDFAYDLDVIIHELGHFVVWTQSGPSFVRNTVHGSSAEPGALNEGLADYFAAIFTSDPDIATYSGMSLGRSFIRTLEGSASCPEAIFGQVHADSQPFSQALWGFRTTLPLDEQERLDRTVLDALPMVGTTGGFAAAVDAIVAEAALQLGDDRADELAEAFAARSVDACAPHVAASNGTEVRSFSQVPAFYDDIYAEPIPGFVQLVVPDDGPLDLTIEFTQRHSLDVDLWGTNEPADVIVLGRAGGPITHTPFEDDTLERFVWDHDGTVLGTATRLEELPPALDGRSIDYVYGTTVSLSGPGPHYVQLANLAERTVTARDLVLTWVPGEPVADTASPGATADDRASDDKTGCGCSSVGLGSSAWLVVVLPALVGLRRKQAGA